MRTAKDLSGGKVPIIAIDPALEQYKEKIMFPEKLAKANQMLKTAKLPAKKLHR